MTTAPRPAPAAEAPQGTSRRTALGLAAAGGLTLAAAPSIPAFAAVTRPASPVLPTVIGDLASSLDLNSSAEWHLARRVCPAPTQAVVDKIAASGRRAWIDRQLDWKKISDSKANGLVKKHLSFSTMSGIAVYKASKKQPWLAGKALSTSRTIRQVFTKRHLYESMVDTMADHLYISADGKASEYVAWFDWTVLRKHALGKYSTMLWAAIRHPAFLIYLDNHLNSKDNPNENLGRELLELSTVGVGHYDEDDVRACSLILTGHGFDWKKRVYRYNPDEHHTGALTIMGRTYANASAADGPATLKAFLYDLAHHEGTARRIAWRLATRYVSDTPSDALLDSLAQVYLDRDTSLAAVVRALLLSDEFADSVGSKWRRPQESMASMIKLRRPRTIKAKKGQQLKGIWDITGTVQWLLSLEGHQPRMWPIVDGYPDQATDWMATQALLAHWYSVNARVNWGNDKQWPSSYASWASALGVKKGQVATEVAERLTMRLTGYSWRPEHLEIVVARLLGDGTGRTLTSAQVKYNLGPALHFVFASPYFKLR